MRVAIVAESFLPHMNGVTGSVLHVLRHLQSHGHDALVLAPAAEGQPDQLHGARVVGVPSLALPGYRTMQIGAASVARLRGALAAFSPDVVHLASPFALGWQGVVAAERHGIPAVAAYQTDIAAYTERYRLGATTRIAAAHIARLHRRATMTLVPSRHAEEKLRALGVDRMRRWGRGVDAHQFHPAKRSERWRAQAGAERIVGYAGRLAAEKQVDDLRVLQDLPGVRLVIVGDGPLRARLETVLPRALFLGHLTGEPLAEAMASFDVFVHPGESETFGQTLQEAHASAVPVVATAHGGPLDLVRSSFDGWLYRPGDLRDLRARVEDLIGDERKRRAFGAAGREAVERRSWSAVCDELLGHYEQAAWLHRADISLAAPRRTRPEPAATAPAEDADRPRWRRYIALGDSLTEGICDPGPDGALRGWADRLALLLAARTEMSYANLAVRSRRVRDVAGAQGERAKQLAPDLVSVLIGANDLVKARVDVDALAAEVERVVATLISSGADVLLVTPFLPRRRAAVLFARRFADYSTLLAGIAARTGAMLLDTDLHPGLRDRQHWGEDLVHLSSSGHRFLAYRAGEVLGVPLSEELHVLDEAFHGPQAASRAAWWRRHALPWIWRRMRGRTAGDGRSAKHEDYVLLGRRDAPGHAQPHASMPGIAPTRAEAS